MSSPAPSYYSRLVEEIEGDIGWEKVLSLSNDLTELAVSVSDASARSHEVQFTITGDYPLSQPQCLYHLPEPIHFHWVPGSSRLKDILLQVQTFSY